MSEDSRAKILLVDDDKELTFILRAHLVAAGYAVEEYHDAESAINALPRFCPDIVVMDLGLPGIDGLEATRRIKNNPDTAEIAIIIVTARSDTDHVVLALEAGAHEYVVKPFDVAELLARIRTVYRLREARRELNHLNDELANQVEQRTARLRCLYNFTRSLNEADSRDEILNLIIEAIREATGSERVSILLKSADETHFHCAKATGIDDHVVKSIRVPISDGIAGKVFATGRTYIANTLSDKAEGDARYHSDSFISTPLVATSLMTSEETLGVLSITDKNDNNSFAPDEIECIRSIADSGAIALHNQLRRERLSESIDVLLMTVGRLAEFRDNETGSHLERVREYAKLLAEELAADSAYSDQITQEFINDLHRAAPMHDIGKVGIPDNILCKPGKLTDEEFTLMKEHSRIGRDVLDSAMAKTGPVPILRMCSEIAGSHHERFDGRGYPNGISGEDIPLSARIIALVDAYDAITSKRRYKSATDHDRGVEIVRSESGKHFDPNLIEPFLRCAARFDEIRRLHNDEDASLPTPALVHAD